MDRIAARLPANLPALARPEEWLRMAMVGGCALALICAGPALPF
ncbi:hypothetical protein ACOYW6_10160 [Parablastomonas sp. CN1-191]